MGNFDTAWQDSPSTATPITSAYLTAVDTAVRTERSDRVPDQLMTKLDQASGSASIVVLGDSTGVSTTGIWPDDLAGLLGARFPSHKVTKRTWASTAYGSVTTVANGSATLTLDIYNGSVSGTKADYPLSRIAAMIPVAPDLVIISYGHNNAADSPSVFQSGIDTLVTAIRGTWPDAPIAVSSQNPRFSPAANITEHAAREQSKRAWAASREYGYVPAWEAFQAQSTPSAFVQSDGIHPTTSGASDGSMLWAKAADAYLAGRTKRPPASSSGSASLTVQDENATVATSVSQLDFQGAGVTATAGTGGEVIVTIPGGSGGSSSLTVQDENGTVATGVTQIDFQGAGVTATSGTGEVVVTIPGGSGGGGSTVKDFRFTVPSDMSSVDEFNDDTLDPAWVRVDSTGAAASGAVWTERGDALSVAQLGGGTANVIRAMSRPLSGAGGSLAVGDGFVTCMRIFGPTTNYTMGGIVFSDGATPNAGTQVIGLAYQGGSSGGGGMAQCGLWTGSSWTASANVGEIQLPASPGIFYRLVLVAANTWRADMSPDGISWVSTTATKTLTLTPTHVGLISSSWASATKGVVSYEFLRRVSGIS